MQVIDYDDIDNWGPWLDEVMRRVGPTNLTDQLRAAKPKYTNDAARIVMKTFGRESLIEKLGEALRLFHVRVYHGTRVSAVDAASIRVEGLRPLVLEDRRASLVAVLEQHQRWPDVAHRLDEVLQAYGVGAKAGTREDDRIHVCFSREGLLRGCNHYLRYGAEVDSHITHDLFGDDSANKLFWQHRSALLVSWIVPYADAEAAANPHGHPYDWLPSLMSCLLSAWAYRVAHPDYAIRQECDDVAGYFHGPVARDAIEQIEEVDDSALG